MLFIADNLVEKYLEATAKNNLREFINNKRYTVSDTSLSYRQINSLDNDKLIPETRENKQAWRKFSFKEMVYFSLVKELKKFGIKHEQLVKFQETFFNEPSIGVLKNREITNSIGEIVIGCVFGKIEIIITLFNNGEVEYFTPGFYLLLSNDMRPHIKITLNDFVNELLKKSGEKPQEMIHCLTDFVLDKNNFKISDKEKGAIRLIRNKDYSAVRIKKKNGVIATIYAEKVIGGSRETTPEHMLEIINARDFQDISIIKRDGKIVSHSIEETYKI